MTLFRINPLTELDDFTSGIDKIFNDVPEKTNTYIPKINSSEDNKNIFIEVELPGVKKDDVKIVLEENTLTINGEKKSNIDTKDDVKYYSLERTFGTFKRSITLPDDINRENIEANFEDGILNIAIAKIVPEPAKEKFIEIK